MAASSDKLGALHELVTDALIGMVKGTEVPQIDEDGEVTGSYVMPPSAAIIQAATKFLSDNKITCVPTDDNKLGELRDQMAAREARRQERRASREDLSAAETQSDFLGGLQ